MLNLEYNILNILNHLMPIKKIRKKIKQKAREIEGLLSFYSNFPVKVSRCKEVINVIGDSHSNFFSGHEKIIWNEMANVSENISQVQDRYPLFRTFHFGPCLAYNTSKLNTTNRVLEKTRYLVDNNLLPPKSAVIICLGEIDCRVHIKKQAENQNRSVEEVIDNILKNFSSYLMTLKDAGFKVICWGPIASQKENESKIDLEYPRYGSETERNKITEIYNDKLQKFCQDLGIGYCSIFKNMINERYETDSSFISSDGVHLSQKSLPFALKSLIDYKIINIKNCEVSVCR